MLSSQDISNIKSLISFAIEHHSTNMPATYFQHTTGQTLPLIVNTHYGSVTVFFPPPYYITAMGHIIDSIVIPLD